jgi:hypothetical protein
MLHDKIMLPNCGQFYYEASATGMGQFGVETEELWISEGFMYLIRG